MMKSQNKPWTLFTSMLAISAFTFGGGFVIVSLMKKKFVDELGWLTEEEMLDMTALAQSAPGPIAINAAILVGRRVAGLPGMLAAVMGTLIPPIVIIGLISLIYGTSNTSSSSAIRSKLTSIHSASGYFSRRIWIRRAVAYTVI